MPAAREPGVAMTVNAAGAEGVAVPLAGATLSHDPPPAVIAAVNDKEPPPVFKMCNCCVRAALPCAAVKLTFCVSIPRAAGLLGSTVSVTGTVVVAGAALGTTMATLA